MAELPQELVVVGRDITAGYARLLERRRRRRRTLHLAAASVGVFCAFTAAAFASGIGGDLQLDPTKWTIFERGSVDGGRAVYVKAHSKADGRDSTFMVEHDATLPRYDAFLLHERTVAAAGGDREGGALCTPAELARAAAANSTAAMPQKTGIIRPRSALAVIVIRRVQAKSKFAIFDRPRRLVRNFTKSGNMEIASANVGHHTRQANRGN